MEQKTVPSAVELKKIKEREERMRQLETLWNVPWKTLT